MYVEDGEMIFHRGVDIAFDLANSSEGERTEFMGDATWWNGLATQIVFLQNIPWIGDWACLLAVNLVVVDIPGGVWRIGESAFVRCRPFFSLHAVGSRNLRIPIFTNI